MIGADRDDLQYRTLLLSDTEPNVAAGRFGIRKLTRRTVFLFWPPITLHNPPIGRALTASGVGSRNLCRCCPVLAAG
jgi:hypothetical protein